MSLFTVDLPPSFIRFRREDASIDFSKLEQEPNKIVKFILLSRKKLESSKGLEKYAFQAMLETFQKSMLNDPNLSDYHFSKLVCQCPELLAANQEKFKERVTAFLDSLVADSDNSKKLRQARKITSIISRDPALQHAIGYPFTRSFNLKDGGVMTMERYIWAEKMPALRPILIRDFKQNNPLDLTQPMAALIEQFLSKSTLPDLPFDELLGLLQKAQELQFVQLIEACYVALNNHINEGNVLQLLVLGLNNKNEQFIKKCINYLSASVNNIAITWTSTKGLEVNLYDLNNNSRVILDCLRPYVQHLVISNSKVVQKLIACKTIFPNVKTLEVPAALEPELMNEIGRLLPSVRKCILHSTFYKKLTPENVRNLSGIEVLSLQGPAIEDVKLFPNLKLCINDQRSHLSRGTIKLEEKNGRLYCELQTTDELDLSKISDSAKNLVTDEILAEILQNKCLPSGWRILRLEGFKQLTDKFYLLIPTLLKDLKKLSLIDCAFTDRTGLPITQYLDLLELNLKLPNISDRTGVAIANRLKNLQVLSFYGSPQLTDETGMAVATLLPHLIMLTVDGCVNLTDKTGLAVASHQKNLILFLAKNCSKFTDKTGVAIASNLKKLMYLVFSGCELMTDITGFAIAENLIGLTDLRLKNCPQITRKSIKQIKTQLEGKLKKFVIDEDPRKPDSQEVKPPKRPRLEVEV